MLKYPNHSQHYSALEIAIMPIEVGFQLAIHAEDYLTERELNQFKQFKHPKRQKEWFTARLVSKLLILNHEDKHLPGKTSFDWTPLVEQYELNDIKKVPSQRIRTIEVLKRGTASTGKPEISLDGACNSSLHLSISHAGGWSVASISSLGAIGIDIEECTSHSSTFYDDFFTPWEKAWVQKNIATEFTMEKLYTLLWTLKESYYKSGLSTLRGLSDLSKLEVRPLSSLRKASKKLQTLTSGFRMSDLKIKFSHVNPISLPKSSFLMMSNVVLSLVAFGTDAIDVIQHNES
jgi:4'-phosphopantetheinyl transferase EntD